MKKAIFIFIIFSTSFMIPEPGDKEITISEAHSNLDSLPELHSQEMQALREHQHQELLRAAQRGDNTMILKHSHSQDIDSLKLRQTAEANPRNRVSMSERVARAQHRLLKIKIENLRTDIQKLDESLQESSTDDPSVQRKKELLEQQRQEVDQLMQRVKTARFSKLDDRQSASHTVDDAQRILKQANAAIRRATPEPKLQLQRTHTQPTIVPSSSTSQPVSPSKTAPSSKQFNEAWDIVGEDATRVSPEELQQMEQAQAKASKKWFPFWK